MGNLQETEQQLQPQGPHSQIICNTEQQHDGEISGKFVSYAAEAGPSGNRRNLPDLAASVMNCTDTPLQIVGDPNRLRSVLYNLLDNAIKFTQASCQLCLTVSVADERLRFEISDAGIRVTTADQAIIFEKYRVGHASAAQYYGSPLTSIVS